MHIALFVLLLQVMSVVQQGEQLWDPATDPAPPVQPAECSVQITDVQHYANAESGDVRLDLYSSGYQFYSLSKSSTQSILGGINGGTPFMQAFNRNIYKLCRLNTKLYFRLQLIILRIQTHKLLKC